MYSCKQADEVSPVSESLAEKQDIKVVDGTLHFKDMDAFKKTIESLNNKSESKLDSWLEKVKFSNSLRFFAKTKIDNHEIEILDVPDPVFASILNADGVYVIGNETHKITED